MNISLGLITALLHDIGYIQTEGDFHGTGAKHTLEHIERGIEFMSSYLPRLGFSEGDLLICTRMIQFTDCGMPSGKSGSSGNGHAIVGKMLGVADLVGQMASRVYLEKLLFLYCEFKEALITDYEDEKDLLRKTVDFYDTAKETVRERLGGMDRFAGPHFRDRWDIDQDLYAEAVSRNRAYLRQLLDDPDLDYTKYLRRRGLAEEFLSRKDRTSK